MDHTHIEEQHIADRYVTGSLDPAEAELFEDHYLSCPECLDRLEVAEAMKRSFARVAEEEEQARSAAGQLALVAWLYRLGRQRQLALLATVVVLLLLPAGLSFYGFAARDRALAEARSAQSAQARLESDLKANQRALADLRAAQAAEPRADSPLILDLDQVRGAAGDPGPQQPQPAPGGSVVLRWVLDPPHSPTYLAILKKSDGKELLRRSVPERETMTLQVRGALLPPGDYTLLVEGLAAGGKLTAAGKFPFRILPPG